MTTCTLMPVLLYHPSAAGVARATAVSTGGRATSVSQSAGGSDVNTQTLASHGGTASADISAVDGGKHSLAQVADNQTVATVRQDTPALSWESAPPCEHAPKDTITTDVSGRMWGFENG